MSAELTGRVDTLEAVVMGFPTTEDFSNLSALNSSRFNDLDSRLDAVEASLSTIRNALTNLNHAFILLRTGFYIHTGLPAATGHDGLT